MKTDSLPAAKFAIASIAPGLTQKGWVPSVVITHPDSLSPIEKLSVNWRKGQSVLKLSVLFDNSYYHILWSMAAVAALEPEAQSGLWINAEVYGASFERLLELVDRASDKLQAIADEGSR